MIKSLARTITTVCALSLGMLDSASLGNSKTQEEQPQTTRFVASCLNKLKPAFGTFNTKAEYYIYTDFGRYSLDDPAAVAQCMKVLNKEYKKMKRANVELIFVFAGNASKILPMEKEYDITFPALDLGDVVRLSPIQRIDCSDGCSSVSKLILTDPDNNRLGVMLMSDVSDWKKAIRKGKQELIKKQRRTAREERLKAKAAK